MILKNINFIKPSVKHSNSQVDKASASGAVDLGLIPCRVKPTFLELVFIAFLLDAQH